MNTPRFARLDRAGQLGCAFLVSAILVFAASDISRGLAGTSAAAWAVALVASIVVAAAACALLERFVLAPARSLAAEVVMLRGQAGEIDALRRELAERTEQQRRLRHDLRGAMSPVLLVADRLVSHADPAVKRSGDIMVRTVERATALLAEPGAAKPSGPSPPAGS